MANTVKMTNRLGLLALMLILAPAALLAGVDTAWVRRYDGPAHLSDYAIGLAVDSQGNVIVTGASQGADSTYDWVTIKYSSTGDSLWANRRSYGGGKPVSLQIDASGNIYVSGNGNGRLATEKYSPSGQVLWAVPYGPQDSVDMGDLAFDVGGSLMLGGSLRQASWDALLVKYRPSGDTAWARYYDVDGHVNGGDAIACDTRGGTYVAGSYLDNSPRENCVMFRTDSLGNRLWTAVFADSARESWLDNVMLDKDGNAVAIGKYIGTTTDYDYLTIKYDSAGETLWTRRYDGPGNGTDKAVALALDDNGRIYVTGSSQGQTTNRDYATVKYDIDGSELWVRRYDGPGNGADNAHAVAVDDEGSAYVTGSVWVAHNVGADCATIKYSPGGESLWCALYNGPGNWSDGGSVVAVDSVGNVCVAVASSNGFGLDDDIVAIKYSQGGGIFERRVPTVEPSALGAVPNPFRAQTAVRFTLPTGHSVTLQVVDVSGNVVKVLQRGPLTAGRHSVMWDGAGDKGSRVPAGVYMVVLEAGKVRIRTKVVKTE